VSYIYIAVCKKEAVSKNHTKTEMKVLALKEVNQVIWNVVSQLSMALDRTVTNKGSSESSTSLTEIYIVKA